MSDIKDGGNAFPIAGEPGQFAPEFGMTLRDYFAAKMLADWNHGLVVCDHPDLYARFADHCYRMADAMLKAREA
jgi:hypothetical protein